MLGVPLEAIRVASLGTTDEIKGRSPSLDRGGKWHWRRDALSVILRGQAIGAYTQTVHLLGKGKVLRIDPRVPEGLFALDRPKEKELLAKAAHESRHYSPTFKGMFTDHDADKSFPYVPKYSVPEEL